MLLTELKNRKQQLESVIEDCNRRLNHAPAGKLKITSRKEAHYYALKESDADRTWKYLSFEKNRNLISKLAERDYAKKNIGSSCQRTQSGSRID